ncbi:MAG: hypothetical protein MJZ46_00455 [Bacteroidales bacterium]|nr:hypothetical protein [Bacteroidales bacterium]
MRRKGFFFILLALMIVASGCAPKIIGKRKHKKIHGCGCEWLQTPIQPRDSTSCPTFCNGENFPLAQIDGKNTSEVILTKRKLN